MLSVKEVALELLHLAMQPDSQIINDLTLMPSSGVLWNEWFLMVNANLVC